MLGILKSKVIQPGPGLLDTLDLHSSSKPSGISVYKTKDKSPS